MPESIYKKIWQQHCIRSIADNTYLLYVDLQMIHEVTSPQAFEGLAINNRTVRRKDKAFATVDHNIPTSNRHLPIKDPISKIQIETLRKNCQKHDIKLFDINDEKQGIVHIIGPEQGLTQPGMVIVCGDSHTATHGAFGALAFGIGTSEVEHVLATQTLVQGPAKTMKVIFSGSLPTGIYAKDMILALIGKIGADGGTGYVLEYCGQAIDELSMEGRMTVCNMSIEAGARAGLVNPDQKTIDYIKGRSFAPAAEHWDAATKYWLSLRSDPQAEYDKQVEIDVTSLKPQVTWGTSPEQVTDVYSNIPKPEDFAEPAKRTSCENALKYMGLNGGEKINELAVDRIFIGSCTNARIEDLRVAAKIVAGKKVSPKVQAMVVPGSGLVKKQAEAEGLAKIFVEAGFEWRDAGCSMCLGMNDDILMPAQRCASTSNRNFEGRQGKGGRTHLVSPAVAAATAIVGTISSPDRL